jgi:Transposase
MFVGWDWASATHDVTVLDDAGVVVDRWAFRHTEQDLVGALERLARLAEPAGLPVIIERVRGAGRGAPARRRSPSGAGAPDRVLGRPRWGASGAKSDPGHSDKLADYLRTDGHRLRRLDPPDVGLQELQALAQLGEDHVRARTAASMKLGALLEAHWPGSKAVFFRLASPIALAFLTDYPTPQAAARLGQARMASLLPPPPLPRRQDPGPAAGQTPARTDRSSRHPGCHPGDPCPRPGSNSCGPCWDHRRARSGDRHPRRCLSPRQLLAALPGGRHHQPGPAAGRGRAGP